MPAQPPIALAELDRTFRLGTTSVEAADDKGWAVSVTPSGGWTPAVIAGPTRIGLSQRMQSFVLDPSENPYNVLAPRKRPRATLTDRKSTRLNSSHGYHSHAVFFLKKKIKK